MPGELLRTASRRSEHRRDCIACPARRRRSATRSDECAAIQDWTLERLERAADELVARGLAGTRARGSAAGPRPDPGGNVRQPRGRGADRDTPHGWPPGSRTTVATISSSSSRRSHTGARAVCRPSSSRHASPRPRAAGCSVPPALPISKRSLATASAATSTTSASTPGWRRSPPNSRATSWRSSAGSRSPSAPRTPEVAGTAFVAAARAALRARAHRGRRAFPRPGGTRRTGRTRSSVSRSSRSAQRCASRSAGEQPRLASSPTMPRDALERSLRRATTWPGWTRADGAPTWRRSRPS